MTQVSVTQGGKERAQQAVTMLAPCFHDDPLFKFFLADLTESRRREYLPELFQFFGRIVAISDSIIYEANDWSSAVIILRPGSKLSFWKEFRAGMLSVVWNVGLKGFWRMYSELVSQIDKLKKQEFGKEDYFYLWIIGTDEKSRGQGISSVEIQKLQALAQSEGRPIWLEASSAGSQRLYERLGFRTVKLMTLGKGVVGADGLLKEGGEGVKNWCMVWRPVKKEMEEMS